MLITGQNLVYPGELPDGSVQWVEHTNIGEKLIKGDPTLGWDGDPSLSLVLNVQHVNDDGTTGRWEVWQRLADGTALLILARDGTRMPGPELIRQMVELDTRRVDVAEVVAKHNAKVDADRQKDFEARLDDVGDKLAFALGRDLGVPAQSGRPYPVGAGGDLPH
jgi:hypothetical protein